MNNQRMNVPDLYTLMKSKMMDYCLDLDIRKNIVLDIKKSFKMILPNIPHNNHMEWIIKLISEKY